MTNANETTPPADEGRLEAAVRPRAWALPIPAMAGGGDYLRSVPPDFNYPNGEPMPWEPLYDQAALDAGYARGLRDAELAMRAQQRDIRGAIHDAEGA